MKWDFEKTRNLVEKKYGLNQLLLIRPHLNSIYDRMYFASYHFNEYKKILRENLDAKLTDSNIVEVLFPTTWEKDSPIKHHLKQVDANIVACLQNLHCCADTLSHAVFFATGLNLAPKPLKEKQVALETVTKSISSMPQFDKIKDKLQEFDTNVDWQHLSALVNYSKHRSIIDSNLNIDFKVSNNLPYYLEFQEFKYKDISYRKREVDSLLHDSSRWLSSLIVRTGNSLNDTFA
jgi:hypothetical protein